MSKIHWRIIFVEFRFCSENNHRGTFVQCFQMPRNLPSKAAPKNPIHCPNTYSKLSVFTQCQLFVLNCLSKHLFLSTRIYFKRKPASYEFLLFKRVCDTQHTNAVLPYCNNLKIKLVKGSEETQWSSNVTESLLRLAFLFELINRLTIFSVDVLISAINKNKP